jgi:hypothetical protein
MRLAARATQRPTGPQALRQITPESAAGLDVEGLVDRLGRHPHLRIVRELAAQPADYLLGRVAPPEIFLHLATQLEVRHELRRLRSARAPIRASVSSRGAVATGPLAVTRELATDRRRVASQPAGDRSHRLTTRARESDLLPLIKRQTATLQVPATTRTDPARDLQPPTAHHPIGTDLRRGVTNELTALDRSPERLHQLRDHPVRELRHRHAFRSPVSQGRDIADPGPGPDSAPIAAAPRPRARLATTGALLNHQAWTTYKIPPTGRVLRPPQEPANPYCDG